MFKWFALPEEACGDQHADAEHSSAAEPAVGISLSLLEVLWEGVRFIATHARGYLLLTVSLSVATGLLPLVAARLSALEPQLLQQLLQGVVGAEAPATWFTGSSSLVVLLVVVLAAAVVTSINSVAHDVLSFLGDIYQPRIDRQVNASNVQYRSSLTIESQRTAAFKDFANRVTNQMWRLRILLQCLQDLISSALLMASASVSVLLIDPNLWWLVLLGVLPSALATFKRGQESARMAAGIMYQERLTWMYRWATIDDDGNPTTRELCAAEHLLQEGQQLEIKNQQKWNRIFSRNLLSAAVNNLAVNNLIKISCVTVIVVEAIRVGRPLDQVLFHISAIGILATGLRGVVNAIARCSGDFLAAEPVLRMVRLSRQQKRDERYEPPVLDTSPSIELRNIVYKPLGGSRITLQIPFLEIKPGEIVGVCGQIGAGKTTLSEVLCGFRVPTEGQVIFKHANFSSTGSIALNQVKEGAMFRNIAVLRQSASLMQGFTIRQMFELSNVKRQKSVVTEELLREVGIVVQLDQVLKAAPQGLDTVIGYGWIKGWPPSGGQEFILTLARVLISDAPVIILDEPTAHIDPALAEHIRQQLPQFLRKRGKTALVISHAFGDLNFADRVLVMQDGRIVDEGTPTQLSTRPGLYRDAVVGQANDLLRSRGVKVEVSDSGELRLEHK